MWAVSQPQKVWISKDSAISPNLTSYFSSVLLSPAWATHEDAQSFFWGAFFWAAFLRCVECDSHLYFWHVSLNQRQRRAEWLSPALPSSWRQQSRDGARRVRVRLSVRINFLLLVAACSKCFEVLVCQSSQQFISAPNKILSDFAGSAAPGKVTVELF